MTERRNQERGHWGNLTEAAAGEGVGAPGTTGAFKTSDPLGAPGSTGASMTNQDPTAIPAAAYEDPDVGYGDYGGGQRQQLRDPTSGVYSGDRQQQHRDPTSGVYSGHQQQQQQFHDPTSGDYGGGKSQQIRDPTSGVYSGGQQQQLRNPTSGVIGSGDEFESGQAGHGQVGVTGFTRITTGSTPGGGVMFGRETVTRAQDLGPAGAGGDDKGVGENRKDRAQGGPHHR